MPDHDGSMVDSNGNKIKMIFSKRNPADLFREADQGKLLVVCVLNLTFFSFPLSSFLLLLALVYFFF
jgi:hypothetical protein